MIGRRDLLKGMAAAQSVVNAAEPNAIVIDPAPRFDISPLLYMQFMEPLGTTDASVEASWDYDKDDWRADFVDIVRDLAPDAIRFGGLFSRYYHWREGIGPPDRRPWMRNYVWGGKETNRVGTHEFVDFCRRVGAEPFYCVNFLSDGDPRFRSRAGDAREAADWVSYANDRPDPLNLKLWQLGNETSYGTNTFTKNDAISHTIEFAKAMKERDRSIRLIGWGDRRRGSELWAPEMVQRAGEYLDFVAIHMMGQSPKRPDTVLKGLAYQREPERAWEELLELSNAVERRVTELEQAVPSIGIAITEGHLSLSPQNTNPILFEWLSSVYHARSFNIYQRHGARVKIATAADFQGNRWTNTAVMLPTPSGRSFLMPVGSIARLFKRYNGKHGVDVRTAPSGLDIAASRSEGKLYLHVANIQYRGAIDTTFQVERMRITGGRAFEIAPEDLRTYVNQDQRDAFQPREAAITASWRFPAGSVTAVELNIEAA